MAPPLTIGALARPGRRSHIIGCVRYANTSWRREWTVRRTAAIAPASWRSPVYARAVRHYLCIVVSPVTVQRCQAYSVLIARGAALMMGSGMFYRHGGRNENEFIHMNDLMDRCIGHVVGDPQPARNLYTGSEEPSEGWRTELGNTGISECNRRLKGGALERWADLFAATSPHDKLRTYKQGAVVHRYEHICGEPVNAWRRIVYSLAVETGARLGSCFAHAFQYAVVCSMPLKRMTRTFPYAVICHCGSNWGDARRALEVCHCSTPYDERITIAATKNNAITDCELKRQTPARRG